MIKIIKTSETSEKIRPSSCKVILGRLWFGIQLFFLDGGEMNNSL